MRVAKKTKMNKAKAIPKDSAFIKRFLSKIDVIKKGEDDCWEWIWAKSINKYGSTSFRKVRFSAHRVSYALLKKVPNRNLVIDHICSNRLCVNPNHLQELTIAKNLMVEEVRKKHKGLPYRGQTKKSNLPWGLVNGFCLNGHEIKGLGDYYISKQTGTHVLKYTCKQCRKLTEKNMLGLQSELVGRWG